MADYDSMALKRGGTFKGHGKVPEKVKEKPVKARKQSTYTPPKRKEAKVKARKQSKYTPPKQKEQKVKGRYGKGEMPIKGESVRAQVVSGFNSDPVPVAGVDLGSSSSDRARASLSKSMTGAKGSGLLGAERIYNDQPFMDIRGDQHTMRIPGAMSVPGAGTRYASPQLQMPSSYGQSSLVPPPPKPFEPLRDNPTQEIDPLGKNPYGNSAPIRIQDTSFKREAVPVAGVDLGSASSAAAMTPNTNFTEEEMSLLDEMKRKRRVSRSPMRDYLPDRILEQKDDDESA